MPWDSCLLRRRASGGEAMLHMRVWREPHADIWYHMQCNIMTHPGDIIHEQEEDSVEDTVWVVFTRDISPVAAVSTVLALQYLG